MQYAELIGPVWQLDFIADEVKADAAVKTVLGIFVSRLDEDDARTVVDRLPEPLTLERLRSHQVRPLRLSAEQFIEELSVQLSIEPEQARELAALVLGLTRRAIGDEPLETVKQHLPSDWSQLVEGGG